MFLPIILLDEFGWPGFIVFAVPNVLGCAAFGYVLANTARRDMLQRQHRPAMVLFSTTAIAFHLFFMAHLAMLFTRGTSIPLVLATGLPAGVYLAGYGLSRLPAGAWVPVAVVLYAGSMLTFSVVDLGTLRDIAWSGDMTRADLVFLAPVFVFGFLLCPYLDLTFHRALGMSRSRHTFAVFGAAFVPILLLTVAYSSGITVVVLVYITAQAVFTVAAHLREMRSASWPRGRGPRVCLLLLPIAATGLVLVPGDDQDMYLRFLGFYGLIFPAYVLFFMATRGGTAPRRPQLIAYAAAMLAFAPLLELGFIHRITWPAVIPIPVMLAWALLRNRVRR